MNDLYENDFVLWSERQAELLRRRARGELINEGALDWPNIAEEIEGVGNEQYHAVQSLLTNIMQHRLHLRVWPQAIAATHWRREIDGWRVQVRRRFRRAPTLRTAMQAELAELYNDAKSLTYVEFEGTPRSPLPMECPWTLDQLLDESS